MRLIRKPRENNQFLGLILPFAHESSRQALLDFGKLTLQLTDAHILLRPQYLQLTFDPFLLGIADKPLTMQLLHPLELTFFHTELDGVGRVLLLLGNLVAEELPTITIRRTVGARLGSLHLLVAWEILITRDLPGFKPVYLRMSRGKFDICHLEFEIKLRDRTL